MLSRNRDEYSWFDAHSGAVAASENLDEVSSNHFAGAVAVSAMKYMKILISRNLRILDERLLGEVRTGLVAV